MSILKSCESFLSVSLATLLIKQFFESKFESQLSIVEVKDAEFVIAKILLYAGEYDDSLLHFNNVINAVDYDRLELLSFVHIAQLLYQKNDFNNAFKYSKLAKTKAQTTKDDYIIALADLMAHQTSYRIHQKYNFDEYINLLDRLQKLDLKNCYIFACNLSWVDEQSEYEKGKALSFIEKSIIMALEIGNEFGLSTAYQWKGVFLTQMKLEKSAMDYYLKAIHIRDEIGEIVAITKIRNGIGYAFMTMAEYKKAYETLGEIFVRVNEIEEDYTEIVMIMFNMAMILFYGRHYNKVLELLGSIFKIMNIFEMKRLPFQTKEDIDLLRALIYAIQGSLSQATILHSRIMEQFNSLNSHNRPYVYLLGALIAISRNDDAQANYLFETSIKMMKEFGVSTAHMIPWAHHEYALALGRNKFGLLAEKTWSEGSRFSHEYGFDYWQSLFDENYFDDSQSGIMRINEIDINVNYLENIASQAKLVNNLHKHLRDIQYINYSIKIASMYTNSSDYSKSLAVAISDYLITASVYIAARTEEKWEVLTEHLPIEGFVCSDNLLQKFYSQSKSVKFYEAEYELPQNKKMFFAKLDKFGLNGAVIIMVNEMFTLSNGDLKVIEMILSNLESQLVMLKQSEELERLSYTDQLTKLNNRRSLQLKLEEQSELISRYYSNSREHALTAIFFDLDNFKYYNDRFGHSAGDFMIHKFAQLLSLVFRKVDFIARFGGDEFIVLVPETNAVGAVRSVERVYEEMKKQGNFIEELSIFLDRHITIPKQFLLNCSAGICCNLDTDKKHDIEQCVEFADKALYVAKERGKMQAVVWKKTGFE